VVEDNYLTAVTLCEIIRNCGFAVAGPVARLDHSLDLIDRRIVDGALIDINLGGTDSYPLCTVLHERRVPFALVTAYSASKIPAAFRAVPLISKPVDPHFIKSALEAFGTASAGRSAQVPLTNGVLDTLDPDDHAWLSPLMEPIMLEVGHSLERRGMMPTHLVFPTRGVVALTAAAGGHGVEAGLVGREGMTGFAGIMGTGSSAFEATVHVKGAGLRMPMRALLAELPSHGRLHHQLLAAACDFVRQVAETTLTSAKATVEERVARWLLMMCDRLEGEDRKSGV